MDVTILFSTNTYNTHIIFQYSYLALIYFNSEKPLLRFKFSKITRVIDLKSILENMYLDNQKVMKLYYLSIDNERKI